MNTFLWICQALLSGLFFYSGVFKSIKSKEELVRIGQTGMENLPLAFIRFIGIAELAGVAGIILPWLLQITPVLTPVTALCYCFIMVCAAVIHFRRKEYKNVTVNAIIFCIALFVSIQRFKGL